MVINPRNDLKKTPQSWWEVGRCILFHSRIRAESKRWSRDPFLGEQKSLGAVMEEQKWTFRRCVTSDSSHGQLELLQCRNGWWKWSNPCPPSHFMLTDNDTGSKMLQMCGLLKPVLLPYRQLIPDICINMIVRWKILPWLSRCHGNSANVFFK